MDVDPDFLKVSATKWEQLEKYQHARQRCASLVVVNDVAERGVKLITDFNEKLCRDYKQQEYLLQVIEHHRHEYPLKW